MVLFMSDYLSLRRFTTEQLHTAATASDNTGNIQPNIFITFLLLARCQNPPSRPLPKRYWCSQHTPQHIYNLQPFSYIYTHISPFALTPNLFFLIKCYSKLPETVPPAGLNLSSSTYLQPQTLPKTPAHPETPAVAYMLHSLHTACHPKGLERSEHFSINPTMRTVNCVPKRFCPKRAVDFSVHPTMALLWLVRTTALPCWTSCTKWC